MNNNRPADDNKVVMVLFKEVERWGCINCGCDTLLNESTLGGIGTCQECGQRHLLVDNEPTRVTVGFYDEEGNMYHPEFQEHPRKGIPKHLYDWPDYRPEGGGEFWSPRGIGYDLSGFVKSKLAGIRIWKMVKSVLGTDRFHSWLDWREHEPAWIQFKFQKEEFDLEKLEKLVNENNKVITEDILKECCLYPYGKQP